MHYTLASDPWWCWTPGVPLTRPSYVMGKRVGSAGYAAGLPCFDTHERAIRATLEGHDPTMPAPFVPGYSLSVADILDLRVSVKSRVEDIAVPPLTPCAIYNNACDRFEIRLGGHVMCGHRDIRVIGALLRAERFEPGFIAKALDPAYSPDTMGLAADAREAARRKAAAQAAESRARAQADADAARARRLLEPAQDAPDDLSLDDLLIPPGLPLR